MPDAKAILDTLIETAKETWCSIDNSILYNRSTALGQCFMYKNILLHVMIRYDSVRILAI